MSLPFEITVADVKAKLDAGEKLILIDVREVFEQAIANLTGAELIPMNTVPARLGELDAQADRGTLIVFCHHGMRSMSVVNWLRGQGVEACQSMAGGIDSWSISIDPTVPRY